MRNNGKRVIGHLCLIILLISFIHGCVETESQDSLPNSDNIVYVNWDGSADFTSIQVAIDDNNTLENHTVYVYSGSYHENIIINKTINLIGEETAITIIDANTTADGIRINADDVNITGFTIKNSGVGGGYPNMDAGIDIESNSNNISDCILINNSIGIYTNRAENNRFYNNEFHQCTNYGIYLYTGSDYAVIKGNIFSDNPHCGLRIKGTKYSFVIENLFINNDQGMYFCCGARENTVFHNTFINNSRINADDYVGGNHWSNIELEEGNYWDDYSLEEQGAYDNNSDGLIDTPYVIKLNTGKDTIQDEYPLTTPYITHKEYLKI
jgi:parallel beta-helix repeat protein